MLAEIAQALEQDAQADIKLPVHEEDEDFIKATLQFGAMRLRVYYEHSLSYLALANENEAVLSDAAHCIQPHVAIVS